MSVQNLNVLLGRVRFITQSMMKIKLPVSPSTALNRGYVTNELNETNSKQLTSNRTKRYYDFNNKKEESSIPSNYRFKYPEFLPDPNPLRRNTIREKLERSDMLNRRNHVVIPEFYVGSIVKVTYSEPHAPDKTNQFLGICIQKRGSGLRADFTLRNVIDHQGIEVNYDMYDPCIQKIECIKLEKRLDDELLYLRDAPSEYSTFPLDMKPVVLPEGASVPINDIKIPLKPPPWVARWELKGLKGVSEMQVSVKRKARALKNEKPWEKYDLMKRYRETIPEEEQVEVYSEVYAGLHEQELKKGRMEYENVFIKTRKK